MAMPVLKKFINTGTGFVKWKLFCQKKIFSGRGVPPPEKESDEEVLEYVSKNAGAIGYVAESTEINGYSVKLIEIVD